MYRNNERKEADRGIYATTLFEREALGFLKNTSPEIPFFLYIPFNAPHNSSALDPKFRGVILGIRRVQEALLTDGERMEEWPQVWRRGQRFHLHGCVDWQDTQSLG